VGPEQFCFSADVFWSQPPSPTPTLKTHLGNSPQRIFPPPTLPQFFLVAAFSPTAFQTFPLFPVQYLKHVSTSFFYPEPHTVFQCFCMQKCIYVPVSRYLNKDGHPVSGSGQPLKKGLRKWAEISVSGEIILGEGAKWVVIKEGIGDGVWHKKTYECQ
jgi:hypothetical protein